MNFHLWVPLIIGWQKSMTVSPSFSSILLPCIHSRFFPIPWSLIGTGVFFNSIPTQNVRTCIRERERKEERKRERERRKRESERERKWVIRKPWKICYPPNWLHYYIIVFHSKLVFIHTQPNDWYSEVFETQLSDWFVLLMIQNFCFLFSWFLSLSSLVIYFLSSIVISFLSSLVISFLSSLVISFLSSLVISFLSSDFFLEENFFWSLSWNFLVSCTFAIVAPSFGRNQKTEKSHIKTWISNFNLNSLKWATVLKKVL